jgi:hypothetical protein
MAADNVHARAIPRKKIQARIAKKAIDVDKIAKLVRLLASDRDGEVLATVAALKRTLDVAGLAQLSQLACQSDNFREF